MPGGASNEERSAFSESPQDLRDSSEGLVLTDLLKDVPHLTSEKPKDILKFCSLKAIYELRMVPEYVFLAKLLPKVRGSLLTFFGSAKCMEGLGSNVKLVC
jgi:hypothetical protein